MCDEGQKQNKFTELFVYMKNDLKWEYKQNEIYNKNLMTHERAGQHPTYMIARYFQLYNIFSDKYFVETLLHRI